MIQPDNIGSVARPLSQNRTLVAAPRTRYLALKSSFLPEFIWVTYTTLSLLLNTYLGKLAVALLLLSVPLYILINYRKFTLSILRASALMSLPLFAICSVIWSIAPNHTIYYGVQYGLTFVVGILFGVAVDRRALFYGLMAAFFLETILSLILGQYTGFGAGDTDVFVGLMGSKNASADVAALAILLFCSSCIYALKHRKFWMLSLSVMLIALNFKILFSSSSTGSLLGVIFGIIFVIMIGILAVFDRKTGLGLFLSATLICSIMFVSQNYWLPPLEQAILKEAHKDSTLTGRTYIWKRADIQISKRPALGLGYSAFWIPGNVEAEGIWQTMGIASKSGFNFHNSFREILVHLGIVGLILFGLIYVPTVCFSIIRPVLHPSAITSFFSAILIYNTVRMPFESLMFNPFSYSTVLIVASLASAFGALEPDTLQLRQHAERWIDLRGKSVGIRGNSWRA